jgi:hypothetical protein
MRPLILVVIGRIDANGNIRPRYLVALHCARTTKEVGPRRILHGEKQDGGQRNGGRGDGRVQWR